MLDRELGGVHPRSGIQFAQRVIVMAFLQERKIRRFGEVTLIVQQMKNAHRLLRDQMDDRQIILRQTNGQSNYFYDSRAYANDTIISPKSILPYS